MSIDVSVTQQPGYLSLKAEGIYTLPDCEGLADRVVAESSRTDCTNILIDLSELTGNVSDIDRFWLGEYVARVWKPPLRVAIVYRASEINKFFENVASNRAVSTRVEPDVQTALKWLMG
jgi:hypothetical protein